MRAIFILLLLCLIGAAAKSQSRYTLSDTAHVDLSKFATSTCCTSLSGSFYFKQPEKSTWYFYPMEAKYGGKISAIIDTCGIMHIFDTLGTIRALMAQYRINFKFENDK